MSETKSEEEQELARTEAHARAWELARRQGVEPVRNAGELYGDFWPEEDEVDDFLAWLRTIRHENELRDVPE